MRPFPKDKRMNEMYLKPKTPPWPYLFSVADHYPKAVATYLRLWNEQDDKHRLHIYKADVRHEYLTSLAKFRHDLFLLVKEGLASVEETPKAIYVELTGWDDENYV
jgi:hypothetical protein